MLLEKLKLQQRILDLTDAEFAGEIGISPSLWTAIRGGYRRMTDYSIRGILRRFPEFSDDVLLFLSPSNTDVEEDTTLVEAVS